MSSAHLLQERSRAPMSDTELLATVRLIRAAAHYREAADFARRLGIGCPHLLGELSDEMTALRAVITR